MFRTVILQSAIVMLVAMAVFPWLGSRGAQSAVAGGGAYILPNLLFVLRLQMSVQRGGANAGTFFVGELAKIAATIALLVAAHRWLDVHWVALLVGLFAALKANLFAFLLKS